jgi:hypothetical protein
MAKMHSFAVTGPAKLDFGHQAAWQRA